MKESTLPSAVQIKGSWAHALSGDFVDTCWEGQNAGIASSISSFWKETCWTQTFLPPPQNTEVSRSLFYSIPHYLCIKGTEEFFANTYPPPMSRAGDTQPDMQAFLRLLATWKYSCSHREIPLLPVPPSISPRDRPIMGGGCRRAAPTQQGEAWAGFARTRFFPQTLAEHVQAERFEMFIKWLSLAGKQSESHSPAKSQQHRGARAAQIGGYLTVSRQEKLSFLFPKNWWCQSHINHMPYTHTEQHFHNFYIVKLRDGFVPIYSKCQGSFVFQIRPS